MKTKRMIDEQRILNIITAAKFVSYAPIERLTEDNQHLSGGAMIMGWNFAKVMSAMEDKND